jgi:hypothetical protein
MTIKVTEKEDGSFDIEWDENDPQESILNHYTEEDFIRVITEYLDKLKQDDGKGKDLS